MKTTASIAVLLLAGLSPVVADSDLPIQRVVQLIGGLKAQVEADGQKEQTAYDKYACWCENTLERKSADISSAKELISETQILIKKLKGEIASHGAEIAQLNKDIAQNVEAVKEATGVRNKEYKDYAGERTESESCIGALEAAIKALTGAGTGKGFLDTTTHQAQLLAIAGQMRRVLRRSSWPQSISSSDVDLVKSFVGKPMEFFQSKGMSAAQVGQNPFGDYAPQSTQIQGILKGMYDAFTADLEKDNAAEAESQKSFEDLMATKQQEKETLVATLQQQESDSAAKTKKLSESQVLLDDTNEALTADEAFFVDTKDACQAKASEWSVRTRLRTEELNGMATAIKILSSDDAKKTFSSSANTFLQVASVSKHQADQSMGKKAYTMLKTLAARFKNIELAQIAVEAKSGGHFDKVIAMIDQMVVDLRAEEQEDIVHRDLCENQQNANNNEMADLKSAIAKTEASLKRMERESGELQNEIDALESEIKATKGEQTDLLNFRNDEERDFKQALKDDVDAIALMKKAIGALTKFYKDNKIPRALAQKAPEYTEDPDKAPETWSGGYGGRKSESTGILAILDMLVEDAEKEMKEGRADNADAQAKYEKQNGALQETLDAKEETKANVEKERSDLEQKIAGFEKFLKGKTDDKGAEEDQKQALMTDCAWVESHFDSRREKRKSEMQGLVDAKAFLACVDAGDDPLPLA
jgi:peptidoglycan hydrolase CwlO-like protein